MSTLVIGVGRPKPGAPKMPPPERGSAPKMAPKDGMPEGDDKPEAGGKKASPDKAIVIKADAHCISCSNYDPQSGNCEEVDGVFEPEDACHAYFEPMGGDNEQEPDADDQGGAPDMDADDQGMQR